MKKLLSILLISILFSTVSSAVPAKDKITSIKLNLYPSSQTIRPNKTAVLHCEFFGTKKRSFFESIFGSEPKETKLQSNTWKIEILSPNGGVLSKPFLYQKEDQEDLSSWQSIISQGLGVASSKNAVLFTAPNEPGKYQIRLTEGDLKQEVTIEVAASRSTKSLGRWIFSDKPNDKYLELVERYAPFIAQETWFLPKADYILRFDYDDNWKGDDNWENLETGSGSHQAFVYYAVMETETHWFLHYNFFHPRDYSDVCVAGTCHENDNEGLILTIRKNGTEFGQIELMETLAHNNIYSFSNDRKIRNGVHNIDGGIDFYKETHPIVFIEAGGHGVVAASHKTSLFDSEKMDFRQNTGVTYEYTEGIAASPSSGNDRDVSYALLSIEKEWWGKGSGDSAEPNETFEQFFDYRPYGNRPRASRSFIAGAFKGRTESDNGAKPFWGWHDRKTRNKKVLNTGQWALDPAYAISVCFRWPDELPVSTDYTYNPFLAGTP